MKQVLIIITNLTQIPALKQYLRTLPNSSAQPDIIAVGADIELELTEEKITYISGEGLRSTPHLELGAFVNALVTNMIDDPHLSFFSYKGISLIEVYSSALQIHLAPLFYLVDVYLTIAKQYPQYEKWIIFPTPLKLSHTANTLDHLYEGINTNAASFVASNLEIDVESIATPVPSQTFLYKIMHFTETAQRFGFEIVLSVWNWYASHFFQKKKLTILASDLWKNAEALMAELPECELILLDRREALSIGFKNIIKHRMRFVHLDAYVHSSVQQTITQQQQQFFMLLEDNLSHILSNISTFKGMKIDSLIQPVLRQIILDAGTKALPQIEGAITLSKNIKPDVVWVRASASGQTHFSILCFVAKLFKIPSVELQHGILYTGSASHMHRPAVEYIATYGPLVSRQLRDAYGFDLKNLPEVGSPRFDVYKKIHDRPERKPGDAFVVTCTGPALLPHSWSDSYEIVSYYKHLAEAVRTIPQVHVNIKLRTAPASEEVFFRRIIRTIFTEIPHTIIVNEPFPEVLSRSDVLVGIYSTTILEGLISGRPVIYNGFMEWHRVLGSELAPYEEAEALVRIENTEELSRMLATFANDQTAARAQAKQAREFMAKQYRFDGRASKRVGDFLRSLAKK